MFSTSRRLDDHIRECSTRHGETITRIQDLSEQTRGEFAQVKSEVSARHAENTASFVKLYSGLWKVVLAILSALALNYLAQHGFSVPGAH